MGLDLYNIEDSPTFDAWSELDKTDLWILNSTALTSGVLTGMQVTQDTGGDMKVAVAAGSVVVAGTIHAYAGAGSPFTIAAANTADRWDLVIYRVGTGVMVLTGTPCSQVGTNWSSTSTYRPPVKPTIVTSTDVPLAAIYVGYNTGVITTATNVVDRRNFISNSSIVTPASIGALAIVNNLSDVANAGSSKANLHISAQTAAATVYTANVAFSGGGPVLAVGNTNDGYTLAATDLILLTAQTTASQNGLWLIPASGTPSRPTEFPSAFTVWGQTVAVKFGTVYGNSQWLLDAPTAGVIVDTGSQTWSELTGGTVTSPTTFTTTVTLEAGGTGVAPDADLAFSGTPVWNTTTGQFEGGHIGTPVALHVAVGSKAAPFIQNADHTYISNAHASAATIGGGATTAVGSTMAAIIAANIIHLPGDYGNPPFPGGTLKVGLTTSGVSTTVNGSPTAIPTSGGGVSMPVVSSTGFSSNQGTVAGNAFTYTGTSAGHLTGCLMVTAPYTPTVGDAVVNDPTSTAVITYTATASVSGITSGTFSGLSSTYTGSNVITTIPLSGGWQTSFTLPLDPPAGNTVGLFQVYRTMTASGGETALESVTDPASFIGTAAHIQAEGIMTMDGVSMGPVLGSPFVFQNEMQYQNVNGESIVPGWGFVNVPFITTAGGTLMPHGGPPFTDGGNAPGGSQGAGWYRGHIDTPSWSSGNGLGSFDPTQYLGGDPSTYTEAGGIFTTGAFAYSGAIQGIQYGAQWRQDSGVTTYQRIGYLAGDIINGGNDIYWPGGFLVNNIGVFIGALGEDGDVLTAGPLNAANSNGMSDCRLVNDAVFNGTTTITSATANFTTGDVGSQVVSTGGNVPGGTFIVSRTNSTTVVVSNACTSGTGQQLTIGSVVGPNNIGLYNTGRSWLRDSIEVAPVVDPTLGAAWNPTTGVRSGGQVTYGAPWALPALSLFPDRYVYTFSPGTGQTIPTFIQVGGLHQVSQNPYGFNLGGTGLLITTKFAEYANTVTNLGLGFNIAVGPTYEALLPGTSLNIGTQYGVYVSPTVQNFFGTVVGGNMYNFVSRGTVGVGITLGQVQHFTVQDIAGNGGLLAGSVTEQVGLSIPTLISGATNIGIQNASTTVYPPSWVALVGGSPPTIPTSGGVSLPIGGSGGSTSFDPGGGTFVLDGHTVTYTGVTSGHVAGCTSTTSFTPAPFDAIIVTEPQFVSSSTTSLALFASTYLPLQSTGNVIMSSSIPTGNAQEGQVIYVVNEGSHVIGWAPSNAYLSNNSASITLQPQQGVQFIYTSGLAAWTQVGGQFASSPTAPPGLQYLTGNQTITASTISSAIAAGYFGLYLDPRYIYTISSTLNIQGIQNFIIESKMTGSLTEGTGNSIQVTTVPLSAGTAYTAGGYINCTTSGDGITIQNVNSNPGGSGPPYANPTTSGLMLRGLVIVGNTSTGSAAVVHYGGGVRSCKMENCLVYNQASNGYALVVDTALSNLDQEDLYFGRTTFASQWRAIGIGVGDSGTHCNDCLWEDISTWGSGDHSIVGQNGGGHTFLNWYDRGLTSSFACYTSGSNLIFIGGEHDSGGGNHLIDGGRLTIDAVQQTQAAASYRSVTDANLNGTTTIQSATAAFTSADVGRLLTTTGAGTIPAGTYIVSVTDATHIVASNSCSGGASQQMTITIPNIRCTGGTVALYGNGHFNPGSATGAGNALWCSGSGVLDISDPHYWYNGVTFSGNGGTVVLPPKFMSSTNPAPQSQGYTGQIIRNVAAQFGPSSSSTTTSVALTYNPPSARCTIRLSFSIRLTGSVTAPGVVPTLAFTDMSGTAVSENPPLWRLNSTATAPSYAAASSGKMYTSTVDFRIDNSGTGVSLTLDNTPGNTMWYYAHFELLASS